MTTMDLIFTLPRPDPAWFVRSSGHRADGTIHGVRHARRVGVHALELAAELGATAEEREALRVLRILKDADALDRVRFGHGHLKLHLLRFPESRCRIDRAFELVRATEEEES